MKKLLILTIVLILTVVSFSAVLAAPQDNPTGFLVPNVDCGAAGVFDVWVPNPNSVASFNPAGDVGVTKSIYLITDAGYELVWSVPGTGVFKNTIWCQWELDGQQFAGQILVPTQFP